jgi:transposase
MPKAFPEQFCRDVVAMARRGEMPKRKTAEDFGISESCLHRWIKEADVEDGVQDGVSAAERTELRELRRRNKALEQENYILRRAAAYLSQGQRSWSRAARTARHAAECAEVPVGGYSASEWADSRRGNRREAPREPELAQDSVNPCLVQTPLGSRTDWEGFGSTAIARRNAYSLPAGPRFLTAPLRPT